jgi:uncharacterized protein (TIGR02145 family)
MKKTIVLMLCLSVQYSFGQDYQITFSAKGASSSIDSVRVENVTQNKHIIIDGSDVLRLQKNVTVNVEKFDHPGNNLRIYPNPIQEYGKVDFYTPFSGTASIDLFNLSGQKLFGVQKELEMGRNSFSLSGLGKGVYFIRFHSHAYNYTGKIISWAENLSVESIRFNDFSYSSALNSNLKSAKAEVRMQYNTGDQLKYTASSDNYNITIPDVPSENKTIIFEFVECKDADDNYYPVVQLGTQIWMTENLKTTTYNDKNSIPLETDNFVWESMTSPGYCWYDNNKESYGEKYGALYNWYAVETGRLCPSGWHVPSDEEWTILSDFLSANGFAYLGTGVDIAKSMATTWGWDDEDTESGDIGYKPEHNNSSGFSGPPAGRRGGRVSMGLYGSFNLGSRAQWWSSTENNPNAFTRHLFYYQTDLNRTYSGKSVGLSVRCVLTKTN